MNTLFIFTMLLVLLGSSFFLFIARKNKAAAQSKMFDWIAEEQQMLQYYKREVLGNRIIAFDDITKAVLSVNFDANPEQIVFFKINEVHDCKIKRLSTYNILDKTEYDINQKKKYTESTYLEISFKNRLSPLQYIFFDECNKKINEDILFFKRIAEEWREIILDRTNYNKDEPINEMITHLRQTSI